MQQEIIETKTEEELEMKKILWKEITEKKKSLVAKHSYSEFIKRRYRPYDCQKLVDHSPRKQSKQS